MKYLKFAVPSLVEFMAPILAAVGIAGNLNVPKAAAGFTCILVWFIFSLPMALSVLNRYLKIFRKNTYQRVHKEIEKIWHLILMKNAFD